MTTPARRSRSASRRVAIVAADSGDLVTLQAPLLSAIVSGGHKIMCLAGAGREAHVAALQKLGAETGVIELAGGGAGLFGGRRASAALAARLADWKPNAVLGFGFEPMVLAATAARKAGVPRIVLVASSLGGLDGGGQGRIGIVTRWRAKSALQAAQGLVVHNSDHERRLRELDLVPESLAVRVLPGAGVDLTHFRPAPLPPPHPGLVFAMIARREKRRGVIEFCEAARRVKTKAPGARFVLATTPPEGKAALDLAELKRFEGCVEITTAPDDPRALIAAAHVVVYPSHGEGMAHEVQQALACGRPVITTDVPGCRETVDERVSGVLVPPGDALALASAMESFLRRPDLIAWMSQAARAKAERRFDAQPCAAALIGMLELDT